MMFPNILLCVACFGALFWSPQICFADNKQDFFDDTDPGVRVSEFKYLLGQWQERITSIDVSYRCGGYSRNYPPGTFVYCTMKMDRRGRFLHFVAHGYDKMNWRDDPLSQAAIGNTTNWVHSSPINRIFRCYDLDVRSPLPGSLSEEFYLQATGLWPSSRPRSETDRSLQMVVESERYNELDKDLHEVNGELCQKLSWPGNEELYFDINRGCTLVRRDMLDPEGHRLMMRYDFQDFQEFGTDIWLPMKILIFENNGDALTGVEIPRVVEILECSVNNDMPDSMYNVTFPAGSLVYEVGGTTSTTEGIESHLNELVHWYARVGGQIDRNGGTGLSGHWILVGCLVISCLVVVIGTWRR